MKVIERERKNKQLFKNGLKTTINDKTSILHVYYKLTDGRCV